MSLLCKDCRYCKRDFGAYVLPWLFERFSLCTHPDLMGKLETRNRYDLVDGRRRIEKSRLYYCATNRGFECGVDAKFFEARR